MALNTKNFHNSTNYEPTPVSTANNSGSYINFPILQRLTNKLIDWIANNWVITRIGLKIGGNTKANIANDSTGVLTIEQGIKKDTVGGHISLSAKDGVLTINDSLAELSLDEDNAVKGNGLLSKSDYRAFKSIISGIISIATANKTENNLPDVINPSTKTIYLVHENDSYSEYILIDKEDGDIVVGNKRYAWEYLGPVTISLTNYYTKSEIDAKIASIMQSIH